MSSFVIWAAAANHGCYGQQGLCCSIETTREEAVREALHKLRAVLQEDDEARFDTRVEEIVADMQSVDEWEDPDTDEGVRVVLESRVVTISL